jgi:putative endonuclease
LTSIFCESTFVYMRIHEYFTYIITNQTKTVLYTGITNSLGRRLSEHYFNGTNQKTFTGRYKCCYLLYFETYQYVQDAIFREKQIKKMNRKKKEKLIETKNPCWLFLNETIMVWPPVAADRTAAALADPYVTRLKAGSSG